jgi:CRP-like cAMP-binding protein
MTIAQILNKTSLFKALSDDQLKAVIQLGQKRSFERGEEIYRHGQQVKKLYVLLSGAVSLKIDGPEELDIMAEALEKPGSVFGMAALSKSHVYSVTATCTKSTTAFALDSDGLRDIIRREPAVGLEVMAELAQLYLNRLNYTRRAITNLFKIFKSQIRKAEVFDVYSELD